MEIQFLDEYQDGPNRDGYKFIALANNRRIVCVITKEALRDNFEPNDKSSTATIFAANKSVIEELAASKIGRNIYEQDGKVIIQNEDFSRLASRVSVWTLQA